ncbi:MAG: radical SAM protein [Candidatus Omnitrophota bacterium]
MKYIYGPVKSRRLGLSLGVSLTPYKTCTFDCIYCQLGDTTHKTTERKEYIKIEEILNELKAWLGANNEIQKTVNYITLSGSGEPTLNVNIGEFIFQIKRIVNIPVAVITNSSFLSQASVRSQLLGADLIVPSLDAVSVSIWQKIDRPELNLKLDGIIQGLVSLRKEFKGKIWLEVMLVSGINDDIRQIKKLKEAIDMINPDKIQLNSPVRVAAESGILAVDKKKLEKIQEILGDKTEII